jgi:hypothetical protein
MIPYRKPPSGSASRVIVTPLGSSRSRSSRPRRLRFVAYLAATGARFSQTARCTVEEFQPELERLMVVVSQKGQGLKEKTHIVFPLDKSLASERDA